MQHSKYYLHSNALGREQLIVSLPELESGDVDGLVLDGDRDIPLFTVLLDLDERRRTQKRFADIGSTETLDVLLEILGRRELIFADDLHHDD